MAPPGKLGLNPRKFLHVVHNRENISAQKLCRIQYIISHITIQIFISIKYLLSIISGAVVAQWIRPQTLHHEVPGSNLLAAAVSALRQGTLSSLPSSSERT